MGRLKGKVAIVTGASKGIGAAIATSLGAEGAAVVVNYSSDKAGADFIVSKIARGGGKAVSIKGDVSKAEDARQIIAEAKKTFGRLDVLVNNAGVYAFSTFEQFSEHEFHRQFNINVLGAFLMTRSAIDLFGTEGGSVINIGSTVSSTHPPNLAIYVATKSALDGITRVLSKELGPKNIRVNSINPGATETEGANAAGVMDPDFVKKRIALTPLGRFGKPEDIASVAVFLASAESNWLTGEIIVASGGYR